MSALFRIFALGALLLPIQRASTFLSPSPFPRQRQNSNVMVVNAMDFKQQPGESDIDFIKRITASSKNMLNENKKTASKTRQTQPSASMQASNGTTNSTNSKPKGTYKRIEEWDEERKASGELTWEEKVQYEGQRFGNHVKQNDILSKHIGTFFFGDDTDDLEGGTPGSSSMPALSRTMAMKAVLDPRDFFSPSLPLSSRKLIASLQRQMILNFASSYGAFLSDAFTVSKPSLELLAKATRRQPKHNQQWSVDFPAQRIRRKTLAMSSSSSILTSESSSPSLPSTKILNNALQDAAASFTQDSCQLLGVKSIGVDYGLVKTGVAVTVGYNPEPLEILVWERPPRSKVDDDDKANADNSEPPPILGNTTQIASQVVQIAKREQASQIILGLPLHKNGTEAEQTNHTRVFAQELAKQTLQHLGPNVPVYLWDERYTSKEAAARAHSKDPNRYLYGTLDSEAACIILEHYYHDNGLGAERVVVEDQALVERFTLEWEERVRLEEERLQQQERDREDRLNWRKAAILRDQIMESESDTSSSKKKKKKKKNKRR